MLVGRDDGPSPPARRRVARAAARGQYRRGRRAARLPLAAAADDEQGDRVPDPRGRPGSPGVGARRGGRALPGAAAAARGARRAAGDGAGALQARARAAHGAPLRGGERRPTSGRSRCGRRRAPPARRRLPTLRVATSFLPNDPDPKSAIAWPNIQLCMQLFDRLVEAWPERTIVPSLAERWEISDDGLRYVFHLREGLTWSDGAPLTAHDVEFGIKRVLDPASARLIGRDLLRARERAGLLPRPATSDADRIGVRALDDRTVEFRLVAPAPYFMSVMNRPDGGPQPRHAIEATALWTEPDAQVVSGAFRIAERTDDLLVLERRDGESTRAGRATCGGSSSSGRRRGRAAEPYDAGELGHDHRALHAAARGPDAGRGAPGRHPRPGGVVGVPRASTTRTRRCRTSHLRRALAHAIDRDALAAGSPGEPRRRDRRRRPARAPGPHARHRAALRPRPRARGARAVRLRRRARAGRDDGLGAAPRASSPRLARTSSARRSASATGRGNARRRWRSAAARTSAYLRVTGWFPGYADPEYFLRLLFHSDSRTNEGGFSDAAVRRPDRARAARAQRPRAAGAVPRGRPRWRWPTGSACIPLVYGRNVAYVKPWVHGWWEFGKSSSSFADLVVGEESRAHEASRSSRATSRSWTWTRSRTRRTTSSGWAPASPARSSGPAERRSSARRWRRPDHGRLGGRHVRRPAARAHVVHGAVMGQDLRTTPELIARTTTSCLQVADGLGAARSRCRRSGPASAPIPLDGVRAGDGRRDPRVRAVVAGARRRRGLRRRGAEAAFKAALS